MAQDKSAGLTTSYLHNVRCKQLLCVHYWATPCISKACRDEMICDVEAEKRLDEQQLCRTIMVHVGLVC